MRDSIKQAMNIAYEFTGKKATEISETVWSIGLSDYEDEEIEDAIENFCKLGDYSFSAVTPHEFMKYSDPHGHKAARKRIEETKKLIQEIKGEHS